MSDEDNNGCDRKKMKMTHDGRIMRNGFMTMLALTMSTTSTMTIDQNTADTANVPSTSGDLAMTGWTTSPTVTRFMSLGVIVLPGTAPRWTSPVRASHSTAGRH